MANAKRNGSSARLLKFKPGVNQVSNYGRKAMSTFQHLVTIGMEEKLAWESAGDEIFNKLAGQEANCHLVSTANGNYTGTSRKGNMTKAFEKRKTSKGAMYGPEGVFRTISLAKGDTFEAIVARGIARFAKDNKITIPKLAKEYGIDQRLLYRLLGGDKPQTAGANAQDICNKIGITLQDLLNLGTPQP